MKKRFAGMEESLRKTWDILLPFLIYFVVKDLVQVLFGIFANASIQWFGTEYKAFLVNNLGSVNGVINAIALLAGMAAVWPMASKEFMRIRAKKGKRKNASPLLSYSILILFAITLALGVNVLFSLLHIPETSISYTKVSNIQYKVDFAVGIVIYGLLTPLAEEIVFRGLIYNRLKKYYSLILSIFLSGFLFGIYHGNMVQAIYGCILGAAITYAYEVYGNFVVPFLFHSLANLSAFGLGYKKEIYWKIVNVPTCIMLLVAALLCLLSIVYLHRKDKIVQET